MIILLYTIKRDGESGRPGISYDLRRTFTPKNDFKILIGKEKLTKPA